MTKKTETAPAVARPPAGNVTIATARRGHQIEDLRGRIREAQKALDSMTPLGGIYDPGGHLARSQAMQRQVLLDSIEQWRGEADRLSRLEGDALVWEFCTREIAEAEAARAVRESGLSLVDTLARGPRPNVVRVDRDQDVAVLTRLRAEGRA